MDLFGPSMDEEVDRRIENGEQHGEKTLFGAREPTDVFLPESAGAG